MSELALLSKPVLMRRLALAAIAALAGVFYAWALGQGTLEYYYGAAVRSMSLSWHNFIFGAFDSAGSITLDKLPRAFWLQALSVRAFGFHPWALVLPQVIEGVVTVLVLYRAVARLAGPAAGLIASLVLAVSPATVALDRGNISDSLMILLLVLAADAGSAAIAGEDGHSGRLGGATGRLVLAGVWVALAFQAKMIEAWMVLPAMGLAYLLAGPGPAARRAGQLVIAGVVAALQDLQEGAPDLMAAETGVVPSLVIYDSGLEALPIGGLTGAIPSPTLGQLQADIRAGRFHLVWIATDTDPRPKWIATHCSQMSPRFYTCQPADVGRPPHNPGTLIPPQPQPQPQSEPVITAR